MSELTALIHETVAAHPRDSHETIAQLVADATPADRLDGFYTEALEPLVAQCVRLNRKKSSRRAPFR